MMASLFAGVSGLKNHQTRMNVIGNNIANINTIGYKTSRVNFQEALVQTFKGAGRPSNVSGGTNPVQLGLGMQVASIDTLFQQGGLETTGQITDMAIQGSGFFVLGDTNGNKFYTRAGAFGFDANSNLVDPATGLFVLGKNADSSGNIPSLATTGAITIPFGQQDPARSTEMITLSNNLNMSAATDEPANLVSSGESGIFGITGSPDDGVGGIHSISITGSQAFNDVLTGVHDAVAYPGLLTSDTILSDIGVTDPSSLVLTIDNTDTRTVPIEVGQTIGQLVTDIDSFEGISAALNPLSGEIEITRDYAGDPGMYNVQVSTGAVGNVATQIFGAPIGSSVQSTGGAACTLVATDTFTPTHGSGAAAGPFLSDLGLEFNDRGIVIGLTGAGGGGITIENTNGNIKATDPDGIAGPQADQPLVFETADTSHSMSIGVFDSLGEKHVLSLEFFKSGVDNRWEWEASTLDGESISGGSSGYVQFNNDGSLGNFAYNGGANSLTINPGNGADLVELNIDAGSVNGFDGLTGFSSTHTASIIGQDGYGLGILEKIDIDQVGNISGFFSNGVTRVLAQIALADFSNQAGLNKAGLSMYQTSANSGEAVEGVAGATVSGKISSGALEASSVDIAQEFTNMITAQRGFQANSRIITTSDSMLDELVNIKR
ncbi:MAG: flagellar hook-basal body complex protein [Calditrichaeota bacterium]|nr:MAG: flagellar hook-basal body complex protein [Calditrichota bacterium]